MKKFLPLIAACVVMTSFSQVSTHPDDQWMLKEVLADSVPDGIIYSKWFNARGLIFHPQDLMKGFPRLAAGYDILLKKKGRLFFLVDGSGRVYEIKSNSAQVVFQRQDSTVHFGYNYGALNFVHHDTIFSLGGYGFWTHNGHLRYYREETHGWEVSPLNTRVQALLGREHYWFYDARGQFYFITDNKLNNALKPGSTDSDARMEEGKVLSLDMRTRDWTLLGKVTEAFDDLKVFHQVANSPWGPLTYLGPPLNTVYLVDYRSNAMLRLKDGKKLNELVTATWFDDSTPSKRIFSWYTDSSVVIMASNGMRNKLQLLYSDFEPTSIKIYEPKSPINSFEWTSYWWVLLVAGVSYFFYQKFRKTNDPQLANGAPSMLFEPTEIRMLCAFLDKPDLMLSIEEVDECLGTTQKTKDVQNQKRSLYTRSVNQKSMKLTGNQEPLITTVRMEYDRRSHKYAMNKEKAALVSEWVSGDRKP